MVDSHRTAGGECIPDGGASHFQGYGRRTVVHKVLYRAGEIACKGRHDVYLGSDGGFMIPMHSENGHKRGCMSRDL